MFPLHVVLNLLSRWTKQNAKFILMLTSVAAAVVLVAETRPIRTIEAERIVLRGADGLLRAKLEAVNDSTELAFYNNTGKVRVAIKVAPDGDGFEMRDDIGRCWHS